MTQTITVHSFRRGRGKSQIAANLATVLAVGGRRVGIIDTDLRAPGLQGPFGLADADLGQTLNAYLRGLCPLPAAALDLTTRLGLGGPGRLVLVPADPDPRAIALAVRQGYTLDQLHDGL